MFLGNDDGQLAKNTDNATLPPVLDACCGSRMFWFDRKDQRATFVDKRRERHAARCFEQGRFAGTCDCPRPLADFTDLPFPDNTFALVVFDPPHFERNGATGWVGLKYGTLKGDWREELRQGFAECFRVLRPEGFDFQVVRRRNSGFADSGDDSSARCSGHRSGKQQKTHWVTFMKPNAELTGAVWRTPERAGLSRVRLNDVVGHRWRSEMELPTDEDWRDHAEIAGKMRWTLRGATVAGATVRG